MRKLQEFCDEPGRFKKSADVVIRGVEKLPLPYTGNKKKLLYHIHDALCDLDIEFDTVLDAFAGSASVALLFKLMGKRVIANDLLTSSYLFSVAFVENPGIKLTKEEQEFLLHNQNPHKGTFVEDNYLGQEFCPPGKKCRFNKFTLNEARHLDNFRANIDELCGIHAQSLGLAANAAVVMRLPFGQVDASVDVLKHRKKQDDCYGSKDRRIGIYYDDEFNLKFDKWFFKYLADFSKGVSQTVQPEKIKRAAFLANLQQHVLRDCMVSGRFHNGQALAEIHSRLAHPKNQLKAKIDNHGSTEMDFYTRAGISETEGRPGEGMKWWSFAELDLPGQCVATNMDVVALLKSGHCNVDCVYFDPPYGGQSSDYATIYRFLEEYIYSTPLEELPHIQASAQRFVRRRNYEQNFVEMLDASRHIPIWLFSYNDNSWKDIDYISGVIKQFRSDVQILVLSDQYRYLYRKCQGRVEKSSEYLIVAR